MLKLNRMTDYAVVVLGRMARQPGLIQTAAHIAEGTAIPLPTASKLLKKMAGAALITSHRGVNGGYSLDRAAEAVCVVEIIEALDGPIALTACVDGAEDQCDVESLCPMRGNWNQVNSAIRTALENVSLAELIDPRDLFPLTEPVIGAAGRADWP
jgi:FeS assembly SUF system regulator